MRVRYVLVMLLLACMVCGPLFSYDLTVKQELPAITSSHYRNVHLAVAAMVEAKLAGLPVLSTQRDNKEQTITVVLCMREKAFRFVMTIEVLHSGLSSRSKVATGVTGLPGMATELAEIVLQALDVQPGAAHSRDFLLPGTGSVSAITYLGNALAELELGNSLDGFKELQAGKQADPGFHLLNETHARVFAELEKLYLDTIRFSPDKKSIYLKLAALYRIAADFTKALAVIDKALAAFPADKWELLEQKAALLAAGARYDAAISLYQELMAQHHRHGLGLAAALCAAGRSEQSHLLFRELMKRDDVKGQAMLELAACYEKQGEWGRAAELLAQAMHALPGDDTIRLRRATALVRAGRYDSAGKLLRRSGQGECARCDALLGDLAFAKKAYHRALAYYNAALLLEPDSEALLLKKLQSLKQLGQNAKAFAPLLRLARMYARTGAYDKAVRAYSEALAMNSAPDVYGELADLSRRLGRHKQAAIWYERALDTAYAENTVAYLAETYLALDRAKDAEALLLRARDKGVAGSRLDVLLARTYYTLKAYPQALDVLQAGKDTSNIPGAGLLMGMIYLRQSLFQQGFDQVMAGLKRKQDALVEDPLVGNFLFIMDFLDACPLERGNQYVLLVHRQPVGLWRKWAGKLRGKRYDFAYLTAFIHQAFAYRLRVAPLTVAKKATSCGAAPPSTSFLLDHMDREGADGIVYVRLMGTPSQSDHQVRAELNLYRRGMAAPVTQKGALYVSERGGSVFVGVLLFVAAITLGIGLWRTCRFFRGRSGHGALRVRVISPLNRRLPMQATVRPGQKSLPVEGGEALFPRLQAGAANVKLQGVLVRHDDILDKAVEMGKFAITNDVTIRRNDIVTLVFDFSKEVYLELYVSCKGLLVQGAEVTLKEMGISKCTNANGSVSFILPKMLFTFVVHYRNIITETKIHVQDDMKQLCIEVMNNGQVKHTQPVSR